MSLNDLNLCRLCMRTEFLEDLYRSDGEITLAMKTNFCLDIQVQLGDELPSVICKACTRTVNNFYDFKQKCLKVDAKLKKNLKNSKELAEKSEQRYVSDLEYESKQINHLDSIYSPTYQVNLRDNKKRDMNKNNKYQCEYCGRIFKIKTVLENHILIHLGIKPFVCYICLKRFARAENRMIHMRTHVGIRPFICEICGSSSTKRQDLIRHMKVHNDERKYSCPQCSRSFKRSSDLTSHMRTHTGVRPYHCHICEKTYTSHSGLRKHQKTHCNEASNTNGT